MGLASLSQAGRLAPGRPDRIVRVLDEGGALLSETAYREGRKVGRHVAYWPGGRPRVRTLYNGDVIEGEYRSWHANGRLAELKHYEQGHETPIDDYIRRIWTTLIGHLTSLCKNKNESGNK